MYRQVFNTGILIAIIYLLDIASGQAQTFTSGRKKVTLLELYTSEGCNSCPPADKWFSQLKNHPKLFQSFIPISLHVDYWDYLGWKDAFSKSSFSRRQREFARQWKEPSVYTPGFMANGKEFRVNQPLPASSSEVGILEVRADQAGKFHIKFRPISKKRQAFIANVAFLLMDVKNAIKAGENRGKTLTHDFVACDLKKQKLRTNGKGNLVGTVRGFHCPQKKMVHQKTALATWISLDSSLIPIQSTGGYLLK